MRFIKKGPFYVPRQLSNDVYDKAYVLAFFTKSPVFVTQSGAQTVKENKDDLPQTTLSFSSSFLPPLSFGTLRYRCHTSILTRPTNHQFIVLRAEDTTTDGYGTLRGTSVERGRSLDSKSNEVLYILYTVHIIYQTIRAGTPVISDLNSQHHLERFHPCPGTSSPHDTNSTCTYFTIHVGPSGPIVQDTV